MLDVSLLRSDIEEVAKKVALKGFKLDIKHYQGLEALRKELQIKLEDIQAKRNSMSKQIGILKAQGADAALLMQEVSQLSDSIKSVENEFNQVQESMSELFYKIPNILDESVPIGKDENENKEVRRVGVPRDFDFTVKDHVDLGLNLDKQIDFEAASKISGSRFVILKNKIAKLHRALTQYMLDVQTVERGYEEVYVPYLVTGKSMLESGQLPKFEEDLFKTKRGNDDDLYLIPTAEVPLTNLVSGQILPMNTLPLKFVAHTPCFRSEAGSYGRDTRGMIRLHQFDKIELVQVVHPKKSFQALEEITADAENILQKLGLPYRVMLLCSGDTGFCSAKTYDLEVWLPSQNTYREISSCSCFTDYQARRMMARFKNEKGKPELVHTLNGSGLAVGRTLVAILENYQNADGSISVPEVLREYTKFDSI